MIASTAVLGLLLLAPGAFAYTCGNTLDDFDRADSATLGTTWTQQAPTMSVAGGNATNPNATTGLATFNAFSATEVCLDAASTGTGVQYGGVVLRYGALTKNLFVKVQRQGGAGPFTKGYFYVGNNGSGAGVTPSSVDLVPFASGRLHVFVVGNRVTLDIDTNFDGTPEQSFGSDFPAVPGTGTGVGIVAYGGARLDNFRQPTPGSNPTPTTPGGGSNTPDKTSKLTLGSIGLSKSVFRATTGAKLTFRLSKAASVKVTLERKGKGRKVKGKCVKPKRSNRRKPSCSRYAKLGGSIKFAGKAGANSFTLRGRLAGKTLKPGSYRLSARATDTDDNKTGLKRKTFRIAE